MSTPVTTDELYTAAPQGKGHAGSPADRALGSDSADAMNRSDSDTPDHVARYSRIYTDSSGDSRFEGAELPMRATNFAPPVDLSAFVPAARVGFMGFPANWTGEPHRAPRRQFVIFLEGEVEVTDGQVRRFRPGDVVLLEDTSG